MMGRWTRLLIVCVVLLTAVVLTADAVLSIASGLYLNFSSGVWLALARDAYDGVLYRPLWNGVEYGGTRYFPMLFIVIAALMRAGVSPVAAGVTVSMLGLAAMVAAVFVLLKRLSAPSPLAMLGAALSTAPYFVHQTGFAVRCEPIATAFALSGLAVLAPSRIPDALMQLHGELAERLRRLQLPVDTRRYQPHVTLARHAGASLQCSTTPAPVHWSTTGHVLAARDGKHYRVLRFYLGDPKT